MSVNRDDSGERTEDRRLDAAIDRAVRDLMSVEPRSDLRGRVLEAIERPRRRFSWTWVLAPAAAVAILVIAVVLMQPAPRADVPRPGTDIVLRTPPTPVDAPSVAPREERRAPSPARFAAPRERQAHAAALVADDTMFSSARPEGFAVVDALAQPAPLRMETIPDPGPSTPPDLDIAPLRVAPLEVNALPETPRERQE